MILSTRHIGIVVTDIEKSLLFYESLLGLTVFMRSIEKGGFIEKTVGIPNVTVEWVKLKSVDGFIIELLQYHSHPGVANEDVSKSDRIGCSHVAFTVSDIQQVHSNLIRNGYDCNASPQLAPNGKAMVMYGHDPDGIIIEFVEEMKNGN